MEWISVENGVPTEGVEVLACDSQMLNLDNIPKYYIATYRIFKNRSVFIEGPYILENVTHWMPLPDPPKK